MSLAAKLPLSQGAMWVAGALRLAVLMQPQALSEASQVGQPSQPPKPPCPPRTIGAHKTLLHQLLFLGGEVSW